MVNYMQQNGFTNIKADLKGFDQPEIITWSKTNKGHIPDVSGMNRVQHIVEVETVDTINHQHTDDQWNLFAAYASQHNAQFIVLVPKGYDGEAKKRLAHLGITAEVFTA
jgi:hypothetical protein